jgi:hypothetical protein
MNNVRPSTPPSVHENPNKLMGDRLDDLATLTDAHAPRLRRAPHHPFVVDADAVRATFHVCPHAPIRQTAVVSHIPRAEAGGKRLSDDQCRSVGRDGHAVRERDAIRDEPCVAVDRHESDDS